MRKSIDDVRSLLHQEIRISGHALRSLVVHTGLLGAATKGSCVDMASIFEITGILDEMGCFVTGRSNVRVAGLKQVTRKSPYQMDN
jgi:hypothetical protein